MANMNARDAIIAYESRLSAFRPHFNRCNIESRLLRKHLEALGLQPTLVKLVGYKGNLDQADERWREFKVYPASVKHYVVLCEGEYFDLTAKQFDPQSPGLVVLSEAQIAAKWEKSYKQDTDGLGSKGHHGKETH